MNKPVAASATLAQSAENTRGVIVLLLKKGVRTYLFLFLAVDLA